MLGSLFCAIEVACERLNRRLDASKIRVCTVVNTYVADVFVVRLEREAGLPSG
jgi:hypothetical protein